jgi:hypothetical protein
MKASPLDHPLLTLMAAALATHHLGLYIGLPREVTRG